MPRPPHVDLDGHDALGGRKHCLECWEPVTTNHKTLSDHVMGCWRHYLRRDIPEVIATDERGLTIEGVVAVPARRILSQFTELTHVVFCEDCFHGHETEGCGGCGESVDEDQPHSVGEFLNKRADQYNYNYRHILWHIECLPVAFERVRTESNKLKELDIAT